MLSAYLIPVHCLACLFYYHKLDITMEGLMEMGGEEDEGYHHHTHTLFHGTLYTTHAISTVFTRHNSIYSLHRFLLIKVLFYRPSLFHGNSTRGIAYERSTILVVGSDIDPPSPIFLICPPACLVC